MERGKVYKLFWLGCIGLSLVISERGIAIAQYNNRETGREYILGILEGTWDFDRVEREEIPRFQQICNRNWTVDRENCNADVRYIRQKIGIIRRRPVYQEYLRMHGEIADLTSQITQLRSQIEELRRENRDINDRLSLAQRVIVNVFDRMRSVEGSRIPQDRKRQTLRLLQGIRTITFVFDGYHQTFQSLYNECVISTHPLNPEECQSRLNTFSSQFETLLGAWGENERWLAEIFRSDQDRRAMMQINDIIIQIENIIRRLNENFSSISSTISFTATNPLENTKKEGTIHTFKEVINWFIIVVILIIAIIFAIVITTKRRDKCQR